MDETSDRNNRLTKSHAVEKDVRTAEGEHSLQSQALGVGGDRQCPLTVPVAVDSASEVSKNSAGWIANPT